MGTVLRTRPPDRVPRHHHPALHFPFGLFLIGTHNIWSCDRPLFLTIAGWGMTIKSTLYILIPGLADHTLARPMATTPRSYQIVGAVAAIFGAAVTWQALTHRWSRLHKY